MYRVTSIISVVAIMGTTFAVPTPIISSQYLPTPLGRNIEDDTILPIRIALKQSNVQTAHSQLVDISNPASSKYGQHLSKQEVNELFAPTYETFAAVKQWLKSKGISGDDITTNSNGDWLAVDLLAREAEHIFQNRYYEYEDNEGNVRVGCTGYNLPMNVNAHVDYIVPDMMIASPPVRRLRKRLYKSLHDPEERVPRGNALWHLDRRADPSSLQNCSGQITPACIRALYGMPQAYRNDTVNSLGIFEAQLYYAQGDLDAFFTNFAPNVPNGTHPNVTYIDNPPYGDPQPQNGTRPLTESDIDLEIAHSLIYPQSVQYYQVSPNYDNKTITGGQGFIQASLNFLDALDGSYCTQAEIAAGNQCGTVTPPRIISISYDTPEINNTAEFNVRQCNEFLKLALQGHTIIVSSGDEGVASVPPRPQSNGCIDPAVLGIADNGSVFTPLYPASCPYVLACGATQLNPNQTVSSPETAMLVPGHAAALGYPNANYTTAGGFSNVFPAPSWQQDGITHYFENYGPSYPSYQIGGTNGTGNLGANGGLYNRGGRGIPDVSANGGPLATYIGGNFTLEYGTSLAAPIWASIFTLINEERTAIGKGSVGFVNQVMHDIYYGSNPGCNTAGFKASEGWDPLTGLGTPNYPALLELFIDLP